MTLDDFRLLALALPQVRLTQTLGNISLMAGGRMFATFSAPSPDIVVLRLTPQEQAQALARAPLVFSPQAGGAGARGHTCVRLSSATGEIVLPFLKAAAMRAGRGQQTLPPRR